MNMNIMVMTIKEDIFDEIIVAVISKDHRFILSEVHVKFCITQSAGVIFLEL
ncbi:Uncharacterised protein [Mycobacteroides abscessus subsp. abscessus]|nr:Uncharacterised protein [Mycobacteroides abscessus subsp. abscessus]